MAIRERNAEEAVKHIVLDDRPYFKSLVDVPTAAESDVFGSIAEIESMAIDTVSSGNGTAVGLVRYVHEGKLAEDIYHLIRQGTKWRIVLQ